MYSGSADPFIQISFAVSRLQASCSAVVQAWQRELKGSWGVCFWTPFQRKQVPCCLQDYRTLACTLPAGFLLCPSLGLCPFSHGLFPWYKASCSQASLHPCHTGLFAAGPALMYPRQLKQESFLLLVKSCTLKQNTWNKIPQAVLFLFHETLILLV